jgi:hypothetical protein
MLDTMIETSLLLILVVILRAMTPFRLEGGKQHWVIILHLCHVCYEDGDGIFVQNNDTHLP